MTDHEQILIPVKFAHVDKNIVPIVLWLNTLDDVITLYSCEGSQGEAPTEAPYIMFFCRSQDTLIHILRMFGSDIRMEVTNDLNTTNLLYIIRFESFQVMQETAASLEKDCPTL